MSIHLDVYTRLHDDQLRRDTNRLNRDLERSGRDAGNRLGGSIAEGVSKHTPKIERAYDKVADALGRVNVEQAKHNKLISSGEKDRAKLITQSERLASATRKYKAAVRDASQVHQDLDLMRINRSLVEVGGGAAGATSSFRELATSISAVTKVGGPIGTAALVLGLVQLTGVAAQASGALALLPGAAGAAGAAFGTLKIATIGFGDAMKEMGDPEKFAEALQALSPNAQQAALSIKGLVDGPMKELKTATQDAFFAGVGPQLNQLTTTLLPSIQKMTTGIASAFNQMFMGVTNQLMTPETQAAIQNITDNISQAFQNLAPAAAPLTQAFSKIISVGSDFLPQLATAASQAAQAFSQFITEASQSGQLQEFIQGGLDAMKQLAPIASDLVRAFLALAPAGEQILPEIAIAMDAIADTAPVIATAIAAITPRLTILKGSVDAVSIAFNAIKTVVQGVKAVVEPILDSIKAKIDAMLGPFDELLAFAGDTLGIGGGTSRAGTALTPTPPGAPTGPSSAAADRWLDADAAAGGNRPFGLPKGMYRRRDGSIGFAAPPSMQDGIPTPLSGPYAGSGGGPKLPDQPVVPFDPSLPQGIPGVPKTAGIFSAESSFLDARNSLAEKRARVTQLEQSAQATADEVQKAKNEAAQAERDFHESEMRLQDAWQAEYERLIGASEKYNTQLKGTAAELGEIGAQLDQDFGISKGLAGIAENITKFLANLAFAPVLGALQGAKAGLGYPGDAAGSGLVGIASSGLAGPPQGFSGVLTPGASAMGPAALGGGMGTPMGAQPKPGESAREFAHRAMMPFWQSQGFEVGDHAADQFGEHQNGALDIMVDSIAEGQQVLQQVLSDPNVYGAIFDNKTYGYGRGASPRPYGGGFTGNPTQDHQDHVHAWYKPGGTNNITPGGGTLPMAMPSPGFAPVPTQPQTWGGPGIPNIIPGSAGQGYLGQQPGPGIGAAPGYGADIYSPANTNPALTNPAAPAAVPLPGMPAFGGGGGMLPGMGMPQSSGNTTQIGAAVDRPEGQGSGFGGMGGGIIGAAIGAGTGAGGAALDALAPGAGAAASAAISIGVQEINRAIGYAGQVAGIGVQGVMETFLPTGGSELASNNWLTRIAGGIVGAAPNLPNMAGKSPEPSTEGKSPDPLKQVDPNTTQHGQGQGQAPGPQITVNNQRATEDGTGRDIAWHMQNQRSGPGM